MYGSSAKFQNWTNLVTSMFVGSHGLILQSTAGCNVFAHKIAPGTAESLAHVFLRLSLGSVCSRGRCPILQISNSRKVCRAYGSHPSLKMSGAREHSPFPELPDACRQY
jgi:hypothetical protein